VLNINILVLFATEINFCDKRFIYETEKVQPINKSRRKKRKKKDAMVPAPRVDHRVTGVEVQRISRGLP